MSISKGPINLGKRLRMGLRPTVGAGMAGPPPVAAPGAMPMKKGGKVHKKKHSDKKLHKKHGGSISCMAKGGAPRVPVSSHKEPHDHIPGHGVAGFKHGGAVSKHKGTKHGHHHMRSSGVHKMHHGHKQPK